MDASFAVHDDMKSRTGMHMSLGRGTIHGNSTKQKDHTSSSTHAEVVGMSDALPKKEILLNPLLHKYFHLTLLNPLIVNSIIITLQTRSGRFVKPIFSRNYSCYWIPFQHTLKKILWLHRVNKGLA